MSERKRKLPGAPAGREFLALENASVRLNERIVFERTNWMWRAGEQWGMLGPEGSGKSLLIDALVGRSPLAEGELRGPHAGRATTGWMGPDAIARVSPFTQRQLAVQQSSFYQSRWHSGVHEGQCTVAQFLSQESVEDHNPFEVNASRGSRREFLRRHQQFVRWLGIRALLSRKLVQLSNGEKRKTLLVHALLKAPRLLILEDPFTGLDVATRSVLHRVIERLIRAGTPVLVATTRSEEIPAATTHLLMVDRQRVIALGPRRELLRLWQKRFGTGAARSGSRKAGGMSGGRRPGVQRPPMPLVEFRNVSVKSGRKHILQDVTWTLSEGEHWALEGPNGAGKTTLLNLIQGDHPQVYALNIRLFGKQADSTRTLWKTRQRLGWMSPELHQHYPGEWQAIDVVCSGFFNTVGLYESCSRARRGAAGRWLRALGLAGEATRVFGELTFGQQRLVLLARAAVKRPRLLILDEPCQGLDAGQRRTLLAAVDRMIGRGRISLIFVTHHADELPRCITHVLRLKGGRVSDARRV